MALKKENYTFSCHFHAYLMENFKKISPSAKKNVVPNVTVGPQAGRWTRGRGYD
jgi:hypothetical protein